jgi:hypothetical protein
MALIAAILVADGVVVLIGLMAFLLIVINIQAVDRSSRLMSEPRNFLDASTRRLLGSTQCVVIRQKKGS